MKSSISDQEFLNNYIRFAAVHRWRVANACFDRLRQSDDQLPERAHLALEIFSCYLVLMEDILMWYDVLKKSRKLPNQHLMDILHNTYLVPTVPAYTLNALKEMEGMPVIEFMTLLGFPQTGAAMPSNLSAEEYEAERRQIGELKE